MPYSRSGSPQSSGDDDDPHVLPSLHHLGKRKLRLPPVLPPDPPEWRNPAIELNKRVCLVLEMIRTQRRESKGLGSFVRSMDRHVAAYRSSHVARASRALIPLPRVELPAPDPPPVEPTKVQISRKIETLGDIIALIDEHPISADVVYNVNMERLHAASKPLRALNDMVGMKPLKRSVSDQIVYYVQNLHEGSSNDYMHTVIEGPPGTGKTEVAKLLGSVFAKLGILKKKTFKKATRSDMVAGYLGQTALKTRELVNDCIGGVLFIDEAYALGNKEQKDSYSKECLDTLCEALSDHKHELMVIIAGYADQLDSCFFNYNDGLRSRFAWRFETGSYTPAELHAIFTKKTEESGWSISPDVKENWFAKHEGNFKYAGRDVETLFAKTKIAHSKRLFESSDTVRKMLTTADLDTGYKVYIDSYACKEEDDGLIPSMYM